MNEKMKRFFGALQAMGLLMMFCTAGASDAGQIGWQSAAVWCAAAVCVLLAGMWGSAACAKRDRARRQRRQLHPAETVVQKAA